MSRGDTLEPLLRQILRQSIKTLGLDKEYPKELGWVSEELDNDK